MNNVNKTLYIPLYGKAYVSRKGIILRDKKAEEIWAAEGFELKGKSASKWLAYYMGMRSRVFDNWVAEKIKNSKDAVIIHIGCGMDSRVLRVGTNGHQWYDVDFPEVIKERKRYYTENEEYHMLESDVRDKSWLEEIPKDRHAVIVMEGVSMYLQTEELKAVFRYISTHFQQVDLLMDCYTTFAAKASKHKNPINDVGVTEVYGLDDPKFLEDNTGITYVQEYDMTPSELIEELDGAEKLIFKKLYGGSISKKCTVCMSIENKKVNRMKVGIIGYGSMGKMLFERIMDSKMISLDDLYVSNRTFEKIEGLPCQVCKANVGLADIVDIVFVCVKPNDICHVLGEIKSFLKEETLVVSLNANVLFEVMGNVLDHKIAKVVPSVTAEVGKSQTLVCFNEKVPEKDKVFLKELLTCMGDVYELKEHEMGMGSELVSCMPGFIAAMFDVVCTSAEKHISFPKEQILKMVLRTLDATSTMMVEKEMSFENVVKRVATPGGITEEGTKVIYEEFPDTASKVFEVTLEKRKIIAKG